MLNKEDDAFTALPENLFFNEEGPEIPLAESRR